jgi:hypothetical protein
MLAEEVIGLDAAVSAPGHELGDLFELIVMIPAVCAALMWAAETAR